MYIRKYKIIFIYFKKNLAPNMFEVQPFIVCNAHDSLNPVKKKKKKKLSLDCTNQMKIYITEHMLFSCWCSAKYGP